MKIKWVSLFICCFFILSGCSSKPDDAEAVAKYADAVVENALNAMNTDDYAVYVEQFDSAVKAQLPQEKDFQQVNAQIRAIIGSYISKEFYKVQNEKQYVVVYYSGKFENDEEVLIKSVFIRKDEGYGLVGLFFDSPALRKGSKG